MNGNPYGAVPEALKETRLTLRDLMADHLANKVAEGRLSLAKTQAETETAMVGANLKKEELVNLRDMAHLTQQRNLADEERAAEAGRFATTSGLAREGLQLQTKTQEAANAIAKRHVVVAESAEQRATREETRKNEVKTAVEWVQAAGISPGLLDFLGVDPTKPIKRQDAEHLYATMQATFKSNPALGFMAHGYTLKSELTNLQTQLKDPNLPPDQAAALRKKYDGTLSKFETLDQLIMAEKQPDQAKIVETARRSWSDNATLATQYKNFDEFLQEFSKDVKNIRGVFQEDIKKLKGGLPDKDAPTNAKIDELVKTLTLLPISPVEQKRIIEKAKATADPNQRLLILQEELGKVAQPRAKTESPDTALALMTGRATPNSPLAQAHAAEDALEAKATDALQSIGKRVAANATVEAKRNARAAAENAEAERLKGIGKTSVEISELLKKWRANRL